MPGCTAAKPVKVFIPMSRKFPWTLLLLPLIIGGGFLFSCNGKDQNPAEPIPNVPVNITINLNLPSYYHLNNPGNFTVLSGGNRGIVLVHDFDGNYYAVERTCSYKPLQDCSTIDIDTSAFQLRCGLRTGGKYNPCCQSRFTMNGSLLQGPASYPLKRYVVEKAGSLLSIFN